MSSEYPGLGPAAESLVQVRLSSTQIQAFQTYAAELQNWNPRVNLTAITDPKEIEIKHFLDSLSCLLALTPRPGDRVVDVGTGAGFPGIPLRIACPEIRLVLIESISKKADFCRHLVRVLGLDDVEVVQARAEQLGQDPDYRGRFDWAVARAVANLAVLVEYLLPLLRVGGVAIAQKGGAGLSEAQSARKALEILGGRLQRVVPVELHGVSEARFLVVVEKTADTPRAYPRRIGLPAKRPLTR